MTSAETTQFISSISAGLEDPYLPELACHVLRLKAINAKKPPGAKCVQVKATPAQLQKGIGLKRAMVPVRFFDFSADHKWAVPALVIAVVGVPLLFGYFLGRKRK